MRGKLRTGHSHRWGGLGDGRESLLVAQAAARRNGGARDIRGEAASHDLLAQDNVWTMLMRQTLHDVQVERLWGGAGDEEESGAAQSALLTTASDGALRLWVEVSCFPHVLSSTASELLFSAREIGALLFSTRLEHACRLPRTRALQGEGGIAGLAVAPDLQHCTWRGCPVSCSVPLLF